MLSCLYILFLFLLICFTRYLIEKATKTTTNTVNTGPITVNTQATDGQQVANVLGSELKGQFRGAIDDTDDGVIA